MVSESVWRERSFDGRVEMEDCDRRCWMRLKEKEASEGELEGRLGSSWRVAQSSYL